MRHNPSLESGLSTAGRLARAMRREHHACRGQAVLPRPAGPILAGFLYVSVRKSLERKNME